MLGLVGEYYFLLRSLLKRRTELRPCLKRCRHCRIFFLAHPRNRDRSDLACPFGCKQALRRRRSNERSTAYNRSPAGKLKRKLRNGRQCGSRRKAEPRGDPGGTATAVEREEEAAAAEIEVSAGLVEHVRVVTSLIERRRVSRAEVLQMLQRAMGQRSFDRERRLDYRVRALLENPP